MGSGNTSLLRMLHALRLRYAWELVWRSGPGWALAQAGLVLLQGLLPLLLLYLTKRVVDAVTAGVSAGGGGDAFRRAAVFIAALALVSLLQFVCRSLSGLVGEAQGQAVSDRVQTVIHDRSVTLDLAYYENAEYFDTLHRAQQEAPYRPTRIVNGLLSMGQSGLTLLAMTGLLFSFHWGVAAGLFVAAVPGVLVRVRYSGRLYRWRRDRTRSERMGHYLHALLTGRDHAKEVRLFGLGPLFIQRFRDLRHRLRKERLEIAGRRTLAEVSSQVVAVLAVFAAFLFIADRTLAGAVTLGGLVMYYQAFQRGMASLQEFLRGLADLYEDSLFLTHFHEFLGFEARVPEPARPVPVPRPLRQGIEISGLSFRYPESEREALRGISVAVRAGEHVALVGENGSGKTTLVKLLCRLYDPAAGSIRADGTDLRCFETAAWRSQVSVIFQDHARYHMSGRDNIRFGDVRLPPSDRRVEEAARAAGAHEVLAGLPLGYETVLGKMFETGEELSVGEWQKVALARALVGDAQVLVLDEPTSSLDARAEHEIYSRFHRFAKGKTVFLISHRLSTVRMADRILVLEAGELAESGTHDELIRLGGPYARMFELQARNYRPGFAP